MMTHRIPAKTSLLLAALLIGTSHQAAAQGMAEDDFARHLVGEWEGQGEYQGNTLSVTRAWTLELWDNFMKGDMRVTMASGSSFAALTYWKPSGEGQYTVAWMDASGRFQVLEATKDPETSAVMSEYLDEQVEGGPQVRRWEFRPTGHNTYSEFVYAKDGDEWMLLTEWQFKRVGSPD